MPYELIDHTADIGIRVTGTDIKHLFVTAAHAMFEQITNTGKLEGKHRRNIEVSGSDRTDLLINWLRELLCFWTIDASLVKQVIVHGVTENHLAADIFYDRYSPKQHEIDTEIKAVTYHEALVKRTGAGWEATIIFDI